MKKNILIIEDDLVLQKALAEALIMTGYDVCLAFDGEEGVNKAKSEMYDLILLDIILPVLDGFQVLKIIRSCKKVSVKNIPIIILTNLGQEEDNIKGMENGANDYLIKTNYTLLQVTTKIKGLIGE